MTFGDVLKDLINGLPVYREGWKDGHFIYYEKDWNMFTEAHPSRDWHTLCTSAPLRGTDLEADDWQVDEWDGEEDKPDHIRGVTKKDVVE
jgi:hypothetical protein